MRWLAFVFVCSGCYLSHGLGDDDGGARLDVSRGVDAGPGSDSGPSPDVPVASTNPVCCADACGAGEFCGLDVCGQVTRFVCGPPDGCSESFIECDERSDCADGAVCRSEGDGLFRCLPPLPECSGPLPMLPCNYACSTDEDCPAAASQCLSVSATPLGGCPSVGFCRPFR